MSLRFIALASTLFFISWFLPGATTVCAQSNRTLPDASTSRSSEDGDERMGAPEKEFAARASLARANAEYKQNLKRAGDSATLAISLRRAFQQNRSLTSAQIKNLEQLEKLARRIRGYAGGSDDGEAMDDTPADIGESLTRIADIAVQLQQEVEKTSRQAISAKIITSANELVALVRHARNLLKP
jgi:hypothetical protein